MKKSKIVEIEIPDFSKGDIKVGDRVKLRMGTVAIITNVDYEDDPYHIYGITDNSPPLSWCTNGKFDDGPELSGLDIVEVFPPSFKFEDVKVGDITQHRSGDLGIIIDIFDADEYTRPILVLTRILDDDRDGVDVLNSMTFDKNGYFGGPNQLHYKDILYTYRHRHSAEMGDILKLIKPKEE